jgi:protein SCO1/2
MSSQFSFRTTSLRLAASVALVTLFAGVASAQDYLSPQGPKLATVDQRLNSPVPLNLVFKDESGRTVHLGDYFHKGKPVLLTLNYFDCPMLCNVILEGVVASIADIKYDLGKDYDVVTVSFDPRDTPEKAMQVHDKYTRRYARQGTAGGWHFLTGQEAQTKDLANAVGFHYYWDPKIQQYAHGAAIMVLTPEGRISRYFFGIEYPARDLRLALVEASKNKIGTVTDQFLLLCYHYDPATGRYSKPAMNFVRAGGTLTVLGLAGFIGLMVKREKKKNRGER